MGGIKMIELQGKFNTAKVFTDNVDDVTVGQVIELCNQDFTQGSNIRIMPDTHAGAGCVIGTTMTITDKIVPNLVGVDIGCGMEVAVINKRKEDINFDKLDDVIRKFVPSGYDIRDKAHRFTNLVNLKDVIAPFNKDRAEKSIGTLGGGNHFIELNEDTDGKVYIVIHSGSRNLGKQVAEHYQRVAYNEIMSVKDAKQELVEQLKREGRQQEIHAALRGIKKPKIKKELAYLEGQAFRNYMHDMKIAQFYAAQNRRAMVDEIVSHMGWLITDQFTTIHNYIDMEYSVLRKGAVSALKGERIIVPINMRDGSLIAVGKGNADWNNSAPHGAGRLMSRTKAKENIKLEDFQNTMKDVWTTSVGTSTIDEAPMAYKPMDEIVTNTKDTMDIVHTIKPLYNFKAN